MDTRYEITCNNQFRYYYVVKLEVKGTRRRIVNVSSPFSCLSLALFFGLPYGKGSKLRRRPELEGGRAVQVWA